MIKVGMQKAMGSGSLCRIMLLFTIWTVFFTIGCATQLMPTPNLYVGLPTDPFADVQPHFQNNNHDDTKPDGIKTGSRYHGQRNRQGHDHIADIGSTNNDDIFYFIRLNCFLFTAL